MSRFNTEAYDKLYPRSVETDPAPETVVETFRPSQDKKEDPAPTLKVETSLPELSDPSTDPDEEGGIEDGYAEHSKPDSE